jgi:trimeric autotransporter adhesin
MDECAGRGRARPGGDDAVDAGPDAKRARTGEYSDGGGGDAPPAPAPDPGAAAASVPPATAGAESSPPPAPHPCLSHVDVLSHVLSYLVVLPQGVCRAWEAAGEAVHRTRARDLLLASLLASSPPAAAAATSSARVTSGSSSSSGGGGGGGGGGGAHSASSSPIATAAATAAVEAFPTSPSSAALPTPTPRALRAAAADAAAATESALFAGCGGRAGPGAYHARLRLLALNLRRSGELRQRVLGGALPAHALVRLRPEQMRTAEQAQRDDAIRRDALAAAVRLPPPHDLADRFRCDCGSTRQWVRRHVRMQDITKWSETLVCCDCTAIVQPVLRVVAVGAGAAAPAEAAALTGSSSRAADHHDAVDDADDDLGAAAEGSGGGNSRRHSTTASASAAIAAAAAAAAAAVAAAADREDADLRAAIALSLREAAATASVAAATPVGCDGSTGSDTERALSTTESLEPQQQRHEST